MLHHVQINVPIAVCNHPPCVAIPIVLVTDSLEEMDVMEFSEIISKTTVQNHVAFVNQTKISSHNNASIPN